MIYQYKDILYDIHIGITMPYNASKVLMYCLAVINNSDELDQSQRKSH